MGEHWLYKPGVTGSSPVPPTIYFKNGVVVQPGLTRLPVTQEIAGSNPVDPAIVLFTGMNKIFFAEIAQSVEQWTENPRVPSSTLGLGTLLYMIAEIAQR